MMAPATVIYRNVRSVTQVTGWFVDLADDYWSGQGLGLHHPSWTGDGRADGGSNTVERNLHANRSWTCSNEERGLCLQLLDARGGAQPRVHLRSHRGRPLPAQRRDQIPQQQKVGSDYRPQHRRLLRAVDA